MEQNSTSQRTWKAPEHEHAPKGRNWYVGMSLTLFIIIIYALFTNNPIMAITFILIGITGYLHLSRTPKELVFKITPDGVQAGNELYEYESIYSFWIFYEPELNIRHISLHTKAELLPYVHIPLGNEDPAEIREMLLKFVPEEKHKERLIDRLEKFF